MMRCKQDRVFETARPGSPARRWLTRAAAIAAIAWVGAAPARELDVNIHDDAAELSLLFGAPEQMTMDEAQLGGSLFFNNDNDVSVAGILHVQGPPAEGFSPLQFGAGVKGYAIYLDEINRTVGALGLGVSARLRVPAQIPQALVFKGHTAPKITAFGRADRLFEASARYELDFTPQAAAYIGYRYFRVTVDGGPNQTIDSNAHIGIRVRF